MLTDSYRSLELIIQAVLFLFYEPNVHDALYLKTNDLERDVNRTKYGTEEIEEFWYLEFANIYRGPDPKPVPVSVKFLRFSQWKTPIQIQCLWSMLTLSMTPLCCALEFCYEQINEQIWKSKFKVT